MRIHLLGVLCLSAAVLASPTAYGQASGDIRIDYTNNLTPDGFFMTPVWFGFQDGVTNPGGNGNTFDLFNNGEAATPGLEALAEDGITSLIAGEFTAANIPGDRQGVILGTDGFGGAPVIDPGETATAFISPINPANYQYLTLATMIIPSNDIFVGNGDPEAFKIFNDDGSLNDLADGVADGQVTFQIFGDTIYDAGTEENDTLGAAFFPAGNAPGLAATDTIGGVVSQANGSDLANFLGTQTAAGTTIGTLFDDQTLIATITVSLVPEPTSFALMGLATAAAMMRRKRC